MAEETEFRIYVWGMETGTDAEGNPVESGDGEFLASTDGTGGAAGLRILGWVENQPPKPIEAGRLLQELQVICGRKAGEAAPPPGSMRPPWWASSRR